jgi:hypothetical protein
MLPLEKDFCYTTYSPGKHTANNLKIEDLMETITKIKQAARKLIDGFFCTFDVYGTIKEVAEEIDIMIN